MDIFATETLENAAPVKLELKSQGEIVEDGMVASITQTETEQTLLLEAQFGDLKLEERKMRPVQEQQWIQQVGLRETFSDTLPENGKNALVIGVNSTMAIALVCETKTDPEDWDGSHPADYDDESLTQLRLDSRESIIAKYKIYTHRFETTHFYKSMRYDILHRTHTKKDALRILEYVQKMEKEDPLLARVVRSLVELIQDRVKVLPHDAETNRTMEPPEPPGGFPSIFPGKYNFAQLTEKEKAWNSKPKDKANAFEIWMCRGTKWFRSGIVVYSTQKENVPAVAFNEQYLLMLYMPNIARCIKENIVFIDVFDIKHAAGMNKRIDRFALKMPSEFPPGFLVQMNLSPLHIATVSYSIGTFVFDIKRQVPLPRLVALTHKDKRHVLHVTHSAVIHPNLERPNKPDGLDKEIFTEQESSQPIDIPAWCGYLAICTNRGECFTMCWRTGQYHVTELAPNGAAIFGLDAKAGRLVLQSPLHLSGMFSKLGPRQCMQMARTLAIQSCGGLVYILDKHGEVYLKNAFVQHALVNLGRYQPKQTVFQYAYQGIYASPMAVHVLYVDGTLRKIHLGTEK